MSDDARKDELSAEARSIPDVDPSTPGAPAAPSPVPPDDSDDAIFESLWKRVVEAWDDDKPHQALLEYAIRAQKLPDAAGRYRAVKDDDPAKAERAQKKLDGIVIAATQMLMAMKTPPARYKVPPSITATAFGVVLIVLVWLWYVVAHRGR